MSKLVWLLLLHIVFSTNTVYCAVFLEPAVRCSVVESDCLVVLVYFWEFQVSP